MNEVTWFPQSSDTCMLPWKSRESRVFGKDIFLSEGVVVFWYFGSCPRHFKIILAQLVRTRSNAGLRMALLTEGIT